MSAIRNLLRQHITKSIAQTNAAGLPLISVPCKDTMREEPSSLDLLGTARFVKLG